MLSYFKDRLEAIFGSTKWLADVPSTVETEYYTEANKAAAMKSLQDYWLPDKTTKTADWYEGELHRLREQNAHLIAELAGYRRGPVLERVPFPIAHGRGSFLR
jgi:hypothetical protein